MVKAARTVFIIGDRVEPNNYNFLLRNTEVTYQIIRKSSDGQVLALCQSQQIDVMLLVFCDRNRSLEILERVKSQLGEDCPPIVVVGNNDAEIAVRAIKLGAADYLVGEGVTSQKLVYAIDNAIAKSSDRTQRSETKIDREQQPSESAKLLPKIIEHLPVGAVFVVDRDLRYLHAVGEALYSAGFTPEAMVGQTIYEVIPPELIAEHEELYQIGLAGESFVREHNAHGATYISRGTPLRDSNGEVYAVLAVSYDITERKQVEAALQRSQVELANNLAGMMQLHRLNQRLLHVERLENILQNILAVAAEFTQTNKGNIQLVNAEGSCLEIIVHQGHSQAFLNHFSKSGSEAICESARRKKQRVIVEDVVLVPTLQGTADLDIFHHDNIRAVQSTPIIDREGQLIGMLNNHYAQPYRPSETQLQLLDLLAQTAADFIERARAKATLAADLKDTRLLQELSTRLVIESDIQVFYNEILATAIALMDADAGTVQILDEDTQNLLLLATQGFERTMTEYFYRVNASSNTSCGKVLATGVRTFTDFDVPANEDPDGSLRMHLEAGLFSAQSTSLISRSGKSIGMVSTHWRKHQRPSDRSLRFLDLLARQAADLIEQQQAKEQLRRAAELNAFQVILADALRSLGDPVQIQAEACRLLGEHLQADRVFYVDIKDDKGRWEIADSYVPKGATKLVGSGRIEDFGWASEELRSGKTMFIVDVNTDVNLSQLTREAFLALGVVAVLAVPLIKEGKWAAAFALHHLSPRQWSEVEIKLTEETAERTWAAVERARAEAALQVAQDNLNIAIEAAQMGTWYLDLTEDIALRHSLRHDQIFGYDTFRAEWGQKIAKNHVVEEDHEIFDAAFARARETGELDFEVRIKWQDGSIHWMAARGHFYFDENGKPVTGAGVNFDITDFKQAEANRMQLLREQAARKEEERRAETLAELDRAKTEFFSNVSHEFRTPLTLLLAPLQDALEDRDLPLPPPHQERIKLAQRNGLRLLKLVNTLLDFSRMEAGRLQANYEPTDLAIYTRELASTFRSAIENAELQLVVDCPPLAEPIYVDRQMWSKIVSNLLSNALKFTFVGTITVSLKPKAATSDNLEQVELTLSDTGTGISAADLPYIFERFYQSKGTKGRSYEGSGIGLSLVRELVKLHGGEIEVNSEVNRGTTFTVTLPTGTAHLPAESLRNTTQYPTKMLHRLFVSEAEHWLHKEGTVESSSSKSDPPRILIVDDNADMRNYLQRLLSNYYQVETANDGLAALTAIRQATQKNDNKTAYDLVLADVMMPVMNGLELLRSLRADPNTEEIPIILLSARASEESQVIGLEQGADDYLFKPFSARELLARIKTNLELIQMRQEVTYRKQVMQKNQALNKTLEHRVQERTARLQAINQELEAFSYSVSHDLQAPLRYISSFAQKLQSQLKSTQIDPTSQRYLKIILRSAEQSKNMVSHLLEFSRLEQTQIQLTSVSMERLLEQVRQQLQPEIDGRLVQWQIEPLPETWGDREMLLLVWQNLLSNAVKYTRDRSPAKITVGSFKRNHQTIFFVRDNGVGFDMKYHERLFTLFQRLHPQFPGTGVGLAHVRRIIHRHGGKIWAESSVDKGATFYFSMNNEQ